MGAVGSVSIAGLEGVTQGRGRFRFHFFEREGGPAAATCSQMEQKNVPIYPEEPLARLGTKFEVKRTISCYDPFRGLFTTKLGNHGKNLEKQY